MGHFSSNGITSKKKQQQQQQQQSIPLPPPFKVGVFLVPFWQLEQLGPYCMEGVGEGKLKALLVKITYISCSSTHLSEHEILLTKHNNINNQYLLSPFAGSNTFIPATVISATDEK